MEVYVAVASTMYNMIPEFFGGEGELMFMRFEMDAEDGTIYARQTVRCTEGNCADHAEENFVTKFVYNTMPAKLEEELKAKKIELIPGKTGSIVTAASKAL